MNNLVTFCSELVCYAGEYSPNHPMVPPGIVYGLANGLSDNLPLVLYDLQNSHQSSSFSFLYWILHYSSVTGVMLIGAYTFKHLFFTEISILGNANEEEEYKIDKTMSYYKKYYDKFDTLCEIYSNSKATSTSTSNLPPTPDDIKKSNKMQMNQVIDYIGQHGNVLMKYNEESEAFEYYADNKNIPFTLLETVSRKLAISFHCTNVIVDRRATHDLKEKRKDNQRDNIKDKVKLKKDKLPISKSNKFIYIGKFSSINPLQTTMYEEAATHTKKYIRSKYSYKDYMRSLNKV